MIKLKKQASRPVGQPDAHATVIMNMQSFFKDTAIHMLYWRPEVIEDIAAWVTVSTTVEKIVEVGGFLLGKYAKDETGHYNVELVKFIAAENVAFSDQHFLDFGEEVLDTVDQTLLSCPDLALVGWFHTHPGHGLFLSSTDMHTQDAFFRKAFQVAIVLDSLKGDFPFAVFTRKKAGTTNQKTDLLQTAKWSDLLDQARVLTQNSADHV